jgi:hypothetical protein
MAATDPTPDAPFECWAVLRPDARGLSQAAAEAAAGPDDRVVHLVDFTALCELARAASDEACAGDGYSDALAAVMLRLGLIEDSGRNRYGEPTYRLTERFEKGAPR